MAQSCRKHGRVGSSQTLQRRTLTAREQIYRANEGLLQITKSTLIELKMLYSHRILCVLRNSNRVMRTYIKSSIAIAGRCYEDLHQVFHCHCSVLVYAVCLWPTLSSCTRRGSTQGRLCRRKGCGPREFRSSRFRGSPHIARKMIRDGRSCTLRFTRIGRFRSRDEF
jgi:hypothetical protein